MFDFNTTEDWLAARARVSPHHPYLYISTSESPVTFGQMEAFVDETTRQLYPYIQAGQHVGLLPSNDLNSTIQIVSLMRLGAVIIPINTRLTLAETLDLLHRSDTKTLLASEDRSLRRKSRELDPEIDIIEVDELPPGKPFQSRPFNLADPFAIIHTSGTSGAPKGAVLTYGNIFFSAMASAYRIGVQRDDRWLCILPLYHVGGLSILLRSILYGTSADLLHQFNEVEINRKLSEDPVTMISLVPTMLHRLIPGKESTWNPAFRLVLLGGAAPSPELVRQCIDRDIPVATTYGLSEAASQVATATPEQVIHKPGSVGKPLMFTSVRIADERGNTQPPGEYGEVLVSGPTVMKAYYNNPEATAKTLQNRELHTGDIGYLDEDGDLWLVQRRSDLIVSGGENVYPVEIETILSQHPAVKDCAVVGIPHPEWGQQVAAAVVLEDNSSITVTILQDYCRQHLAGYKIPRQIKFVETLPQTASGKIQRATVVELFNVD